MGQVIDQRNQSLYQCVHIETGVNYGDSYVMYSNHYFMVSSCPTQNVTDFDTQRKCEDTGNNHLVYKIPIIINQ